MREFRESVNFPKLRHSVSTHEKILESLQFLNILEVPQSVIFQPEALNNVEVLERIPILNSLVLLIIYGSIYLILFLLRSSSLRALSFSKKSTLTISLLDAFRILRSFSGEYCRP